MSEEFFVDHKPVHKDYEGVIKIKILDYAERMENVVACNMTVDSKSSEVVFKDGDQMAGMVKVIKLLKPLVKDVKIKRKSDEKEFKTPAELFHFCDEIVNELFSYVFDAKQLGNVKGKK